METRKMNECEFLLGLNHHRRCRNMWKIHVRDLLSVLHSSEIDGNERETSGRTTIKNNNIMIELENFKAFQRIWILNRLKRIYHVHASVIARRILCLCYEIDCHANGISLHMLCLNVSALATKCVRSFKWGQNWNIQSQIDYQDLRDAQQQQKKRWRNRELKIQKQPHLIVVVVGSLNAEWFVKLSWTMKINL